MKPILVISDLHIGVQRSSGTTPASAESLRSWTLSKLSDLLELGDRVAINGDFFDSYQVPTSDLLQAFLVLTEWLNTKGEKLWLIPGNHDLSKNSANLSSFTLMARLLQTQFPDKVSYLAGANWVDEEEGVYAISHVANQELFDLALEGVPQNAKYALLHCNYDNAFAGQSDHSLSLHRDVAKALVKRGVTLILGHEHQGRTLMNDKVVIVGNQFPTSISDCLKKGDAQADGHKYCLEIKGEDLNLIPTWSPTDSPGGYVEVDWQDLAAAVIVGRGFVRVTGSATAAQSADVVRVISKFRQGTNSFVVANAVKVEGAQNEEVLAQSVEDIRAVNVMDLLLGMLNQEQQTAIRKLLGEQQ